MLLIYKNMPLADIVSAHTSVIPILDRFGIALGVGDSTVEQVCEAKNIDVEFFIAVLNTFLNEGYFPEKRFKDAKREDVMSYIHATGEYYIRYQLPNIEAHLSRLIPMADENSSSPLQMISRMVASLRQNVIAAVEADKNLSCAQIDTDGDIYDTSLALVEDIKSVIIKHITGQYNKNMCFAVLFSLSTLQKDMRHHARIRSRVLLPMMLQ